MVVKNVYHENGKAAILDFFKLEFPNLTKSDLSYIIGSFYQLSNYEEEGVKIRPNIYLTSSINNVVKIVPDCYKLAVYKDTDSSKFKLRIKALMCFCKNNWQVYISYNSENEIEYGLIKALNSIKDKSLDHLIFEDKRDHLELKVDLVSIDVVSGGLIILKGVKKNKTNISFELSETVEFEWESNIQKFVEACIQKINTKSVRKLSDIKNIYFNIFRSLFKGLHGTICLVVDKDFKDKTGYLADGTWLKEPIALGKLFLQSKNYNEFKLISYVELIVSMLNYDGITVVDNAGKILAYNVFIESKGGADKIVGGARRRAAYSLLKYKNSKIVGVYFQSQDGDNFYKDNSFYRRRRTAAEKINTDHKVDLAID
mgnify:CR=1 FL=1